jgi:3-phosphoshikimate 1-carboxyvinyltransferase
MGARLEREGNELTVHPADRLLPLSMDIPGDISSAAFFIVLAASVPGAALRIEGVGVNPMRTGLVNVLRRMGAEIRLESMRQEGSEPVADIEVQGLELTAADVSPEEIPGMIDEVPALCVAAALAEGRTSIRGAGELRVKESDRIGAMVSALSSLGVRCGEYPDGLWIEGPSRIESGAGCDSRGDHRIAMSLEVLSAAAGVPISVVDTACIDTSFPTFRSLLSGLIS